MHVYPFSAVVGSDDLALALTLCAVSPAIGGVLVRGEKGTAKSTMVRAQAVNDSPRFVEMLADVTRQTLRRYDKGKPLELVAP